MNVEVEKVVVVVVVVVVVDIVVSYWCRIVYRNSGMIGTENRV